MKFHLLTREQAKHIVDTNETFYVTKTNVKGYETEMYDYRLASYTDFIKNNAFEMRGLTFVFDGKEWQQNLALNKFFNVNQTVDWMYDDVKNKKLISIADKLDGSMITFVKLPNDEIVAKTKMSFISEQAAMAQSIYNENKNYQNFIKDCFSNYLTPIFEITSPHNQVVLAYENTQLSLLQIRKNESGDYYTKDELKYVAHEFSIPLSKMYDDSILNLDSLLLLKETEEKIEGWVVTFDDGQMAKIKTNWYLSLHSLVGDNVSRENILIKTILDENIDDVLAELKEGSEKRIFIENVVEKVTKYFSHTVHEILDLRSKYFNECNENKKDFALKYQNTDGFSIVMKTLRYSDEEIEKAVEKELKTFIERKTNRLGDAQDFIKKIDEMSHLNVEINDKEIKSFKKKEKKELEVG